VTKPIRFAIAALVAAVLFAAPAVAQTAEELAEKEAKAKAYEAQAKKDPTKKKMKDVRLTPAARPTQIRARTAEQMKDPSTPGAHHEHLKMMAGEWNVRTKLWLDPNRPPMESTGTVSSEMVLGGRFLKSEFDGQMLGQPFQGLGIDGYDNVKEQHLSQWMDSAGTMVSVYEGNCSDNGKVITVFTSFNDPLTGAEKKLRGVTTVIDDGKYTYESSEEVGGEYVKTMEAVFTRK
jgi:hypothetical protein